MQILDFRLVETIRFPTTTRQRYLVRLFDEQIASLFWMAGQSAAELELREKFWRNICGPIQWKNTSLLEPRTKRRKEERVQLLKLGGDNKYCLIACYHW